MKIIAAFIMSAVLLGGCASFFETEARYQSECARHGHKYGTPHMAKCVELKYQKREEYWSRRAEQRWERDLYLIE